MCRAGWQRADGALSGRPSPQFACRPAWAAVRLQTGKRVGRVRACLRLLEALGAPARLLTAGPRAAAGRLRGEGRCTWRTGSGSRPARSAWRTISSIDEAGTSVHLEHILSPLPALEAAAEVLRYATGQAGEQAAPLPTEAGPAHARGGGWGLFEDRGRLLMYQAFLPCTVAVQIVLEDADGPRSGSSARVVGGACVAGAAASIAAATGARLPSACCRRTHGDVQCVSSAYGRTWEAP